MGSMVESRWARAAHRFGNWYKQATLDAVWLPPRLRFREWMFEQWTVGRYDRHLGFTRGDEVLSYLKQRVPKSCFYSTAYYTNPNERKMADKGWRGADLIFDLDGDHLDFVDPFNFPEMLEIIQLQAWKLWNEFLQPEFGFNEDHLHITFSGHRGFHLHYRHPDILGLDSSARRELVNHIRGVGIDVGALLNHQTPTGWSQRLESGTEIILGKLDAVHAGSKEGKVICKELCEIIKERGNVPDSKLKTCSPARMQQLAETVQHPERREKIFGGNYRSLGKHDHLFVELVKGDRSLILGGAGETDEAVTVDVKRQIRMPTSLHGKCGLQVTSLPLSRLNPELPNSFDALCEAIPRYDDKIREIEISVEKCIIGFNGEIKEYSMGDRLSADATMDTFLTLKGWGRPVQSN